VEAAREIADLPNLQFEGVFMHFADPSDDAYSRYQLSRFAAACAALERSGVTGFVRHAASSASCVLYPESRFDMIRPGSAVYGYMSPGSLRERFSVIPAMAWRSAVIQVKDYPAGSDLGYSRTFTTARPTRIAVLPVGYADGYGRAFSNRARVLVKGRRVPVVGMISMDYTMLDVTGIDDVHPGTVATLLGEDRGERVTPEELAEWGDTIPYCVTCGIGPRVGRQYLEKDRQNI
jgi:alanine racemase